MSYHMNFRLFSNYNKEQLTIRKRHEVDQTASQSSFISSFNINVGPSIVTLLFNARSKF
jgi:hypothetical protein